MKQTDIYTEALICLRSILLADHPEFKNWIDWLERDIQDWTQRREVAHHLRAYGGMGSFNDLPSMRGNHDYMSGTGNSPMKNIWASWKASARRLRRRSWNSAGQNARTCMSRARSL